MLKVHIFDTNFLHQKWDTEANCNYYIMIEYTVLPVAEKHVHLMFGYGYMFDSLKFLKKQKHLNPFVNLALNHTEWRACFQHPASVEFQT